MSKKIRKPKAVSGRGYVGLWRNGELGWCVAEFISNRYRVADGPSERFDQNAPSKDRAYLCEITIRPVLTKDGRPITRKPRNP